MNFFPRRSALAALAALALSIAQAETILRISTAPESGASLSVALIPAQPPRFGFAPVRVTIENTADKERTWRLDFRAGVAGLAPGPAAYTRSFTVPAGQTRDTWVYVPIAEPGTPGAAPSLSATGIAAAPAAAPSATSGTRVTISKTATGTKIVRTLSLPSSGTIYSTEETNIDATTGELSSVTKSSAGATVNTRTSKPPAGSEVTYTIDPATGFVSTRHSTPSSPISGVLSSGPRKVTVTTGPASSVPSGITPGVPMVPTKVTLEPTPVGMRVTRVMATSSSSPNTSTYTEVNEIDAQTGIITTTMVSPQGTPTPPRTSAALPVGTHTTYTVNPSTGYIGVMTRIAADPKAAPKVTIVTGPGSTNTSGARASSAPTAGKKAAPTAASLAAAARAARPVTTPYFGPPMTLSVEASGPGIAGNSRVTFSPLGAAGNMRPIAATRGIERALRETLITEGIRTPDLTVIEPAQLPADWRLWSPYAMVLLTTDEFSGLDAARRAALRGWISSGGQLLLVPASEGLRTVEPLGAGSVITLAAPLKGTPTAAEWSALGISLSGNSGYPNTDQLAVPRASALGEAAAEKEPGTAWLTVFLIVFAAVVGPVNLYLLAPAAKRHRLFITTPLISLAAALVLGLTILAQDGTGGAGMRRALVVLVPGDNQAVVIQEQAARSGLLTQQSFALPSDTQLTVLSFETELPNPLRGLAASDLARTDARAEGGWFRSRSRQAHLIQRLVPTRGRVERVGTAANGAPIVQSSLGGTLRDFVCTDENASVWIARELAAGSRVTLEPGSRQSTPPNPGGTPRFSRIVAGATAVSAGRWHAKGGPGDLAPIATLDSIRWQKDEVIYAGTLEGAATKEVKK